MLANIINFFSSEHKKYTLRKEVIFILVLKLLLLYALWAICFSHPIAPHMNMTNQDVASHLIH